MKKKKTNIWGILLLGLGLGLAFFIGAELLQMESIQEAGEAIDLNNSTSVLP